MLVLVVDTSTPAVTTALVQVGRDDAGMDRAEPIAQRCSVDARAHGELLAPAIRAVLSEVGATATDLGAIVAGVGPGPYTGLRVGLVTASTIGHALSIPTYGVCSLDGLGWGTSGIVLVATDARRREIYWAAYDAGARITEPAVNRPDDVKELLHELDVAPTAAAGEGARTYEQVLNLPVLENPRYPEPVALATLAARRVVSRAPSEPLQPLYLRRPDAVEPAARKPVRL